MQSCQVHVEVTNGSYTITKGCANAAINIAEQRTQVIGDTLFYSRACLGTLCNGPLDLPILNMTEIEAEETEVEEMEATTKATGE